MGNKRINNVVLRKCAITQNYYPVTELLRIARVGDRVVIDFDNKCQGRGCYLYKQMDPKLYNSIFKKRILNRAFKLNVEDAIYEKIIKYLEEVKNAEKNSENQLKEAV